jgi:hypothetical protein
MKVELRKPWVFRTGVSLYLSLTPEEAENCRITEKVLSVLRWHIAKERLL